jgi:CRISPR-associated endonuclease/helicase Cas3
MSFETFFLRALNGRRPFAYQTELAEGPLRNLILRVPTGGGKTAAYILAWVWKRLQQPDTTPIRLIVILPMRSLVTQTCACVMKWLGRLELTQQIRVFELLGEVPELRKRQREWLSAPDQPAILIGTSDLLISAALNRGYALSRFRWPAAFGLVHTDALWVIDETQLIGTASATVAQLEKFRQVFGTWRPVYTWWVSATVKPEWLTTVDFNGDGLEILPSDSARLVEELGERYTAAKPLQQLKALDATSVFKLHQPGTLTIAVVNTVARAQALYRDLKQLTPPGKSKAPTTDFLLLHSRLRPPDRRSKAERLLGESGLCGARDVELPPGGRVVVATQVVEAGLDLNARTLITELAPWTSIVQRFGRLNRDGKQENAVAAWVDLKSTEAAPYTADELESARSRLRQLEDVSPESLAAVHMPDPQRPAWVIRQHDLFELFSTEKDLAGGFTDISHFIRDGADTAVYLYWREFPEGGTKPGEEMTEVAPVELCPVPIYQAMEFAKKARLFEWNDQAGRWEYRRPDDLAPGMVLLCDTRSGGYSEEMGWTGIAADRPTAALDQEDGKDADTADPKSLRDGWRRLQDHLTDTRSVAEELAQSLKLDATVTDALKMAACWHDVGKALPQWQAAAQSAVERSSGRWRSEVEAKFPASRNTFRPKFRHEEASALYALHQWNENMPRWTALVAYLIASHHGKVRTALGVHAAGVIPAERLHLPGWIDEPFPIDPEQTAFAPPGFFDEERNQIVVSGKGWTEVISELLGSAQPEANSRALGPFRLAYLEALNTTADSRASNILDAPQEVGYGAGH